MSVGATRAFIQARMSSRRFPGKVLAPFRGEPVVLHVVRAASAAVGAGNVVVATSAETSDDPLEAYLSATGIPCFRGPEDDVVGRFQECLAMYPSAWVLRLCADSPLLDPADLRAVLAASRDEADVITTVLSGASTQGRNAEILRATSLVELPQDELTAHDREHVTPFFYRHPERYSLRAVDLPPSSRDQSLTVDTVEDLVRLEALS